MTELTMHKIGFVIKNSRRVCTCKLVDQHGEMSIGELATLMEPETRSSAYVCLSQHHVPALHDLDVLEYDNLRKRVDRGENLPVVMQAIRYFEENL